MPKRSLTKFLIGDRNKDDVKTPEALFQALDAEFDFDFDPCPFEGAAKGIDGLACDWGERNYVNPPYTNVAEWIQKGIEQMEKGKLSVFLVPARVNSKYWFDFVWPNFASIRFMNKVQFEGYSDPSPMPIAVIIFDPKDENRRTAMVKRKGNYKWIEMKRK